MQDIFVGNYTENGIYKMEFADKKLKQTLKIGNFKNNSYICKYKNYLYSAIEIGANENVRSGEVAVFELKENEAKLINSTISYGESPCFLIMDPTREILYVANYTGGSFVAFKINEDGSIAEKLYFQKFGAKSKIHHIQFSKDYNSIFIVDLGEDCIIEYNINYNKKELSLIEKSRFYFPEKSEPRHMVIDEKNNIYIVTEKSCELYKLSHNKNKQLIFVEKKSILPDNTIRKENYTGCAIKINSEKKNIYVSVRGHDSISIFDIHDDKMELIQNIDCFGKIPRDIAFDKYEKYLLCANQISDTITIFNIENGKLSYEDKSKIEAPTCIVVNWKLTVSLLGKKYISFW